MSDILLVKLESVGSETDDRGFHPPFGILYLADTLEKSGYKVKLVHEEGSAENIGKLIQIISTEKPSLVGFSVVTGPQINPSLLASKKIKENFGIPVVWGGIQPSILPDMTMEKEYIDLIVIGEGEETIEELARVFTTQDRKSHKLEDIKGIGFRKNGQVVYTPARPFIKDLDKHQTAWHYLDIERYIRPEIYLDTALGGLQALAVNTSRGCPWRCGYCYNLQFNNRTFRAQSPKRVIEEINTLKDRHNISGIRFSEDHFFSNKKRAIEIIRGIGIPWTATIRIDDIANGGDSFVQELAENHCAFLRCGIESGSQKILDMIQKDITVDQIQTAVALCKKHKVNVGFFFMLGFPGETWEDVCRTLDLIDQLDHIDYMKIGSPTLFCPFPGTALLDKAIDMGFKSPSTLEGWGATIDRVVKGDGSLPKYVDRRVERAINYLRLVRFQAFDHSIFKFPAKIFYRIAKWRWKRHFFHFPIDWHIADLSYRTISKLKKGDTNISHRQQAQQEATGD